LKVDDEVSTIDHEEMADDAGLIEEEKRLEEEKKAEEERIREEKEEAGERGLKVCLSQWVWSPSLHFSSRISPP
jgi:hypothetical protein